jgi:hypothetical protein
MNKVTLTLVLLLAAANAAAMDLPWQDTAPAQQPQYCKGFVVSGLDSKLVSGKSRTELWLAWNYLIRNSAAEQGAAAGDYPAGRAAFQNAADIAAADAILRDADGNCGLGRTGHQVTGW